MTSLMPYLSLGAVLSVIGLMSLRDSWRRADADIAAMLADCQPPPD